MGQTGQAVKIPLTVNMHIEAFSGGRITRLESGSTNLVYAQYADGRWYAMQRPGINLLDDASATTTDAIGRGCYYWDRVKDKYFVNNGTVYKGGYSGSTMSINPGSQRVFMGECGNYLVIIDFENNKGWTILSSSPTLINPITAASFPPNQSLILARGGAILNGKLYVITTDADIYESDIENPNSWNGLNFINAEIAPDGGVYLTRYYSQLVAFGPRTMQFFEDTGNPVGSTLSARTDIQYDVGALDTDSMWKVGEDLYFVGQDSSGNIGIYVLVNFALNKVSTNDIDSFLTTSVTQDGFNIVGCGMTVGGREFYIITLLFSGQEDNPSALIHDPDGLSFLVDPETGRFIVDPGLPLSIVVKLNPVITIVFSADKGWFGTWECVLPTVENFPLSSWIQTPKTVRTGEGMLSNGDLITMLDDFNPYDTAAAGSVYEDNVYENDVYSIAGTFGTAIPWEVITGVFDAGSPRRKFMGDIWLVHTPTDDPGTVTLETADEQTFDYVEAGTIDASDASSRINRLGSFRRRNFKLSGTLPDQIRMESLSGTVRIGQQ